jgi:hypothetical protein
MQGRRDHPDRRLRAGRHTPDPLSQREPGDEVDDVVLAEVHEPEAERERVRPAGCGVPSAHLRQDARCHD